MFQRNGEFEGDDAIVGDDPNEPDHFKIGGNADVDISFKSEDSFESEDSNESSDAIVSDDPNEPEHVEFGGDADSDISFELLELF